MPFCALTLVTGDPFAVWPRPLHDVLPHIAPLVSPSGALAAFFAEVPDWLAAERDPARLRAMVRHALVAIEDAAAWGAARGGGPAAEG